MFQVVHGFGRPSLEVEKKSVFLELEESKLKDEQSIDLPKLHDLGLKFPGLALPNVNKEEIELNLDDLVFDNQQIVQSTQSENTHKRRSSRSNSRDRRGKREDSRERHGKRDQERRRSRSRDRELEVGAIKRGKI